MRVGQSDVRYGRVTNSSRGYQQCTADVFIGSTVHVFGVWVGLPFVSVCVFCARLFLASYIRQNSASCELCAVVRWVTYGAACVALF